MARPTPETDADRPEDAVPALPGHVVALGRMARGVRDVSVVPDAADRARIASALGLDALRKLSMTGALEPEGARDWALEATLGATVVQPCGITGAPVTTRLDEPVRRRWLAAALRSPPPAAGSETEMPEDDETEPLPDAVDLGAVLVEALSLAVPAFPRAPGAALGEAVHAAPGTAPMRDEDARPFATLRARLDGRAGSGDADGASDED